MFVSEPVITIRWVGSSHCRRYPAATRRPSPPATGRTQTSPLDWSAILVQAICAPSGEGRSASTSRGAHPSTGVTVPAPAAIVAGDAPVPNRRERNQLPSAIAARDRTRPGTDATVASCAWKAGGGGGVWVL